MPDSYFPDGNKDPHIHQHKNGITFTGKNHAHTDLVDNGTIRQAAVDKVLQDLEEGRHGYYGNDSPCFKIAAWIRENV